MNEILGLDIKQVLTAIAAEGIAVSALSPFYAGQPERQGEGVDVRALPLLRAVCDPACSVAARILSPEGIRVTRVYAGREDGVLVRHWEGQDGRHNFRVVEEKEIAREAAVRLMLDFAPSRLELDRDFRPQAFCGWLGVMECWRERMLASLLERKAAGTGLYDPAEVYAAYRRSMASGDLRWLAVVLKELYPGRLDMAPAEFREGLGDLPADLVVRREGGVGLSELGEEIAKSLGSPIAAMQMTVSTWNGGGIAESTLVGLRGMGIFCTVQAVGEDGSILFRNASAPMLELFLHVRLSEGMRAAREAVRPAVPPPPPAMPAARFCAACGKPLEPAARFCAECGQRV